MSSPRTARPPLAWRLLKYVAVTLSILVMGIARALGASIRIEDPERRDRVTQVEKKR
jgi:hypothetical protein